MKESAAKILFIFHSTKVTTVMGEVTLPPSEA
jgi:hypothetical protein